MSDPAIRYDEDYLLWSEQQVALLRRLAAGERVNAEIDWPNLLEEVEDVGLSGLRAVQSLLRRALLHTLKAQAWPQARDAAKWREDAIELCDQAGDAFTPSMRQRIDLAALYAKALARLPAEIDGLPPGPVPAVCPMTLDDLPAGRLDRLEGK